MVPRWLTGDLVAREPKASLDCYGIVVAVQKSIAAKNHLSDTYPFVYYVFFGDGNIEGPLFQGQLSDA